MIMFLLSAPYVFSVGKSYVSGGGGNNSTRLGNKRGIPCHRCSLHSRYRLFPLKQLLPAVLMMLYVDNFMLFFEGDPAQDMHMEKATNVPAKASLYVHSSRTLAPFEQLSGDNSSIGAEGSNENLVSV